MTANLVLASVMVVAIPSGLRRASKVLTSSGIPWVRIPVVEQYFTKGQDPETLKATI